jgi:predicted nicotinamide N-methyase
VLDFASGSGLVAIAAAKAGAARVAASDIDPFSAAAVSLNARLNGVSIKPTVLDLIGDDGDWEVVLAGDVFYDREMADRLMPWFSALVFRGAVVLVGDPGRAYLPSVGTAAARHLRRAGHARSRGCRSQEDLCLEGSAPALTLSSEKVGINLRFRGARP